MNQARDGTRGAAVLMRYTLRLLTAQQFQRAATLVCACNSLHRERIDGGDGRWGDAPFRVGLGVGSKVAPNSFAEAERQVVDARSAGHQNSRWTSLALAAIPPRSWPTRPHHLDKVRLLWSIQTRMRSVPEFFLSAR